jgi:hypothetical protein
MRAFVLSTFALAAVRASSASDGFVLELLTDPSAVCLAGTPAGFYRRPGTSSTWLIEMEGGG